MPKFINGLIPGEIQPDAVVGGCIAIYENVWPDPDITIEELEAQCVDPDSGINWQRAETIGQGYHQDARTNSSMCVTNLAEITGNPSAVNIHNQFNMLLLASVIPYSERHGINDVLYHEPYNVLKYKTGQEYKAHHDGGGPTGRCVSAICYLNSDYSGGEIEFPNFNIKIKPEPGMLILFPSNYAYAHIAHPVTDGTKYAIVTWLKDRI